MQQPSFKDAITICKSIMRNGFDAHIVNTPLQHILIEETGMQEIDLCTDAPMDDLIKMLQTLEPSQEYPGLLGILRDENYLYRIYRMNYDTLSPEDTLTRTTPTIEAKRLKLASAKTGSAGEKYPGFADHMQGSITLEGLPAHTLKSNYLLGIRAMRLAANFDLPIEQNTWVAIVAASQKILDYVSTQQIMDEWRAVAAENMWNFVKLLFESQVLHGLIPEVACLAQVLQTKNDSGVEETVLEHTIASMKHYPEKDLHHDWLGTFAMMLHDVGKTYTAEFYQGRWIFYEHHLVGAKVTRVVLHRLRMANEDIEQICDLVRNHMRFQFMMTDRGIRKFAALEEHKRLIEMSRANIKAREDNYTAFNHNNKYLNRANTPEQMLEPLLNGNEIMEVTGMGPGTHVGVLRNALLQAQKDGKVNSLEEAREFVCTYTPV